MITVYQILQEYCKEQNIPPANSYTLHQVGKSLSHRFLDFIFRQNLPAGTIIENAGFIVQDEAGKIFIVKAYPDDFKSEMIAQCDYFYSQKNKPKIQPEIAVKSPLPDQPVKKRKRIPIPPVKEISVKPSTIQ